MEGVGSLVILAMYIGLFFVVRKAMYSLLKRKQNVLFVVLLITTMIIAFVGFFAYISVMGRLNKERSAFYNEVAMAPSNQAADNLIEFLKDRGCQNDPNSWNRLRAVWIAVNESPNVTTEKKSQLKQFLMLQGLTMHYNDSKVIDNYRG